MSTAGAPEPDPAPNRSKLDLARIALAAKENPREADALERLAAAVIILRERGDERSLEELASKITIRIVPLIRRAEREHRQAAQRARDAQRRAAERERHAQQLRALRSEPIPPEASVRTPEPGEVLPMFSGKLPPRPAKQWRRGKWARAQRERQARWDAELAERRAKRQSQA